MEKTDNRIDDVIRVCLERHVIDGLFNDKFIGPDLEYYSGGRCHSRVLGMLVQSIQNMGYITDIERRVKFAKPYRPSEKKRNQEGFRPDITVVDKHDDSIVGIIEYETIDATEALFDKKIEYFEHAIPANSTLQFIIFFPTLTTLQSSPEAWIEKNRQKYAKPLAEKLQELSKKYPKIEIYFLILDEKGLSSKMIKGGDIKYENTENIWKPRT
ncbi:hypothetical protein FJZ31_11375 [Candidatus Poribacteria bacterium]|nr:hypothetical protein [Candidatus Poribacteria bacterium]